MSVATEFPPVVHIPDRARQHAPSGGAGAARRHLVAVPAAEPVALAGSPIGTPKPVTTVQRRFAESTVSWPLTVAPTVPRRVSSTAPLRLTRRGVVALALLTVLLGALLLVVARASFGSAPASPDAAPAAAGPVVVQPGDTLWTIAQRVAPDRDPRREVDQLRRLNRLTTVALTPGQTLKVG